MPSSIHARLKFKPSRWTSLPSVRSVTTPTASQSADPLRGIRGRNALSHAAYASGCQRPCASDRPRPGRARENPGPRARSRSGNRGRPHTARARPRDDQVLHAAIAGSSGPSRGSARTRTRSDSCSPRGWDRRAWAAKREAAPRPRASSGARAAAQRCAPGDRPIRAARGRARSSHAKPYGRSNVSRPLRPTYAASIARFSAVRILRERLRARRARTALRVGSRVRRTSSQCPCTAECQS